MRLKDWQTDPVRACSTRNVSRPRYRNHRRETDGSNCIDRLVGHNVAFDRPIVLNEYARLQTPTHLSMLPTYCTMKSTAGLCQIPRSNGGYKWPTLQELHRKLFGHAHAAAHDARGDVIACAKCFFELRRRGWATL